MANVDRRALPQPDAGVYRRRRYGPAANGVHRPRQRKGGCEKGETVARQEQNFNQHRDSAGPGLFRLEQLLGRGKLAHRLDLKQVRVAAGLQVVVFHVPLQPHC